MIRSVIQRHFGGLSTNTFLLALASLFSDLSTEMLYPVLPVFLTQTLNASGSIVGLVEGVAVATQNIVQGFSGSLSDKLQKRKSIALFGYFLAAIAKPLMGLSAAWEGVLGARLLDRLGAGSRSAPRDALVASSVAEENRGRAFGLEGMGDNAGAFLGPLVAVLLLTSFRLDIRAVFYLAFIPGFFAFLMVLLVQERATPFHAKSNVDVGLDKLSTNYRKYLVVMLLFGIGNSSNSFLILQTSAVGASLETTILIYAGFNLVAALISYPAGSFSDRWGRKNILLASFVIFAATYLGFALAENLLVIALLFVSYGAYQGIFRAVGKSLATDLVPEQLRASGVGWYNTTIGLAGLVASIVAGLLWDNVGHAAVFVYGAVFAAAGCIALPMLVPASGARRV